MSVVGRGLLVGIMVAAPLGPLALWCMRYTLTHGRMYGLAAGLGAAIGDTFYALVASLGVHVVSAWLLRYQVAFRVVGGMLLLFVGWRLWSTRLEGPLVWSSPRRTARGLLGAWLSALLLALSNPMTALAFLGIFSALGLHATPLLWGSVFLGGMLWWAVLVLVVGLGRAKLNLHTLQWVNRLAGAAMVGFGVMAWVSLVVR